MTIEEELWTDWLESRSIFVHYPALAYLIPYLLGIIFWRLCQISWNWWGREIKVLPYGVFLILITLFILRSYWWRFWMLIRARSFYLFLIFSLFWVGFYYTDYHWKRTEIPNCMRTEAIKVIGLVWGQKKGKWVIKPDYIYKDDTEKKLPLLKGKIQVLSPNIRIKGQGSLKIGDRVLVKGILQPFPSATNPGQFDYQRYQRYLGFAGQMLEPEVYFISRPRFHLLRWMEKVKKKASDFFSSHLSVINYRLVMALLTGEKDYLEETQLNQFRDLGISHLLAISGLHLGLVVMWIKKILEWIRMPKRIWPWVLIVSVWLAVIFVGCQPSALRVGIFITLTQLGQIFQRSNNSFNLLAVTAWLILLKNPLALFLLSFQLSFTVYLTILLLYQPMVSWLKFIFPKTLNQLMALSFTAFLGSAPLILFHFYRLSFLGILMNLWAVPLIGVILILLLISLLIRLFWPFAGTMLTFILDYLVGIFNQLLGYFTQHFRGIWQPGRPLLIWIYIFYLSLWIFYRLFNFKKLPLYWYQQEKRIVYKFILLTAIIICLILIFPLSLERLEWVMLDVGQGDGMFLQLPNGFVILIDGGGELGKENYSGEKVIKPFLLSRGIRKIDLVCITHFDIDHVRGILPILEEFDVKRVWAPQGSIEKYAKKVERLVKARQIPLYHPVKGQVYKIGNAKIEIFHPEVEQVYENENDRSLVFRLSYKGIRILFTGDLGQEEEKRLVETEWDIKAHFLKVGHHGSRNSTSYSFLKKVEPAFALISVGENRYGHPAQIILKRLQREGCQIWRTDKSGAIQVLIQNGQVYIQNFFKLK
ncbi:DNA internalization-related competence protein ComEC/Rec2 [Anoxybacter fermentans]|uniref:DNA internalization-related competence protein ComEC/Rec2 n=1 Tax=Anoxybacter fermentans TaxID=1323375 RepID=A0A3Q9HQK8_9FIRM|nr:DNA internalization-related competence protein ComEC/Rec2 [Anoxybacter fermentans]AZR73201.1 DNA internalization-related competence protein ComEC/Rec2 [Anoxybacter fermentans]